LLKEKDFIKSLNYLESLENIKTKWAESYLPQKFTGGVHSTSRAESINALLKRYVSSKSEITDCIRFFIDFEKKSIFEGFKNENNSVSTYSTHPLILSLKRQISGVVFDKHFEQFILSHNYYCKFSKLEDNITTYEARHAQAQDPNRFQQVRLVGEKCDCVCDTFYRYGLICRHIFALAVMFQDKTTEKLNIHQRWFQPSQSENANDKQVAMNNESYDFNTKTILECIENTESKTDEKDQHEEKKIVTFAIKERGKGAPKKEKRLKGVLEIKSKKENFK